MGLICKKELAATCLWTWCCAVTSLAGSHSKRQEVDSVGKMMESSPCLAWVSREDTGQGDTAACAACRDKMTRVVGALVGALWSSSCDDVVRGWR